MAWITPKTNWTAADGVDFADLNRIEGDISFIATNPTGTALQLSPGGGNVLIKKTNDEGEGLQIGSGGMRVTGTAGNIIADPNGVKLSFTRNNASYIWSSTASGYLAFGTNGRAASVSEANLILNTDKTNTSVGALLVDEIRERSAGVGVSFVDEIKVDEIRERSTGVGVSFINTVKWKYYKKAAALNQDEAFNLLSPLIPNVGEFMAAHGVGVFDTSKISITGIYRSSTTQISVTAILMTSASSVDIFITEGSLTGSYTFELMINFEKM